MNFAVYWFCIFLFGNGKIPFILQTWKHAIVEAAAVSKIIMSAVSFVFLPFWGIEIRLDRNAKMASKIFLLTDIC